MLSTLISDIRRCAFLAGQQTVCFKRGQQRSGLSANNPIADIQWFALSSWHDLHADKVVAMSAFEWAAVALIVFGMVIPFWLMVIITVMFVEQNRKKEKTAKVSYVHDYARLVQTMNDSFKSSNGSFNGPAMIAYLRELRLYPQYREPTLLFLEEITITGKGKFDAVCKAELSNLETYLLDLKSD